MADISRIGAAQDALKTLLAARAGLANVPLDLGFPPGGPQDEHVWISGRVDDWDREYVTTGPNTGADAALRREDFVLKVIIVVSWRTTSYVEARDRALALQAEVERCVLSNPTLSDSVFQCELAGGSIGEGVSPDLRQVVPELNIACEAHLAG